MNTVFNSLQDLCNKRLLEAPDNEDEFDQCFKREANLTVNKISGHILSIDNSIQIRAFFNFSMQELTRICDTLFEHFGSDGENVNVLLLLDIMFNLKQTYSSLVDNDTSFPVAFRKIHGKHFKDEWEKIKDSWKAYDLPADALEMASLPFEEFYDGFEELSWHHFTWLKRYVHYLKCLNFNESRIADHPEYLLAELLIRMGFNLPMFMGYCSTIIKSRLEKYTDRAEQIFIIAKISKEIQQLPRLSNESFFQHATDTTSYLVGWLAKEGDYRSRFENIFQDQDGKALTEDARKFQYHHWNSLQIAFWYKTQMDMNIIKNVKLEDFDRLLARNCSSSSQTDLKSKSFNSKYYLKSSKLIAPIAEEVDAKIDEIRPTYELLKKIKDMLDVLNPKVIEPQKFK